MDLDAFWLRLVAGATFSQPIKEQVAKRWAKSESVLLALVILMICFHYWAQDPIGPLTLVPVAFCLSLTLMSATTRLLSAVFYLSVLSVISSLFMVLYFLIDTEGQIFAADISVRALFLMNTFDTLLSTLIVVTTLKVLNEHDIPNNYNENEDTDNFLTEQSLLINAPSWEPYSGVEYKLTRNINVV